MRQRCCSAAECGQQFPPPDGDCHTPLPREVRKGNYTTPRACCPNSTASGAGGAHAGHRLQRSAVRPKDSGLIYFWPRRFTSSRTCETILTRAVFSEGDAARPITASQPPVRARSDYRAYRSRLARPLFFKAVPTFDDPVSNRSVDIRAVFRPHPPIGLLRGAPDVSSGEPQYPPCLLEQSGTDRARR